MTSSSKSGLTVVLIALFVCSLVYANEPNATDTDLVFEISDRAFTFDRENEIMLQIKPAYVVELFLLDMPAGNYPRFWKKQPRSRSPRSKGKLTPPARAWSDRKQTIDYLSDEVINALLGTSAAKSFSTGQRQLCKSGYTITYINYQEEPPGSHIGLLAVSEQDARTMTMAFLEFLQNEADKQLKFWEDLQKRWQKEIPIQEQKIKEAEQKKKALGDEYAELKKQVYYSTTVVALETISEMNKMLQAASIEQASVQAKKVAIENFIAKNRSRRDSRSKQERGQDEIDRTAILQKLEQKLVDETIELISIEAKVSAVSSVLAQAKKFGELDESTKRADDRINSDNQRLAKLKSDLQKVESVLADPEPHTHTKPPKVLENKAVIYPLEIKD